MDRRRALISIFSILLLISVIKKVTTDLSDDACGRIFEEKTSSNETKSSFKTKKDYKGLPRPDQKSLIIVFDATRSMSDDLAQLKSAAKEIVNKLANSKESPIYNYVLSVFRDPDVELPLNTKTSSDILTTLDNIVVRGGGDCPELALQGIKTTLDHALKNSLLYVFSDASAKDYDLYEPVIDLLQEKKVKASFLLTGVCKAEGKEGPGYTVYEKLARASGGQMFDMERGNIAQVLLSITEEMDSHYELLKSLDSDVAGKSRVTVKVDESFKKISVSLSGKNSKLAIKNSKDENVKTESLVSLDNVKVLRFEVTGASYHIEASAESGYSIRAGGISDLKLEYGFSTNVPSEIAETSNRPLIGFSNVISIFVSDPKLIKCLTKVTMVPAGKHDDFPAIEIPLVRYKRDLFASAPREIPAKMFKIIINGYDNKGNEFERSFASGIESIKGSPPKIEIEEGTLKANQYQELFLDCKVISLTPAVTTWMFEDKIIHTKHSNQSTNAVLKVSRFDVKNVGKYTCKTVNSLGEAKQLVSISIRMAPIVEVEPKKIEVLDGEIASLTCKVTNNEGDYKIRWLDNGVKYKNEKIYKFEATKYHHNRAISCIVQNEDFEVSNSCSISVLYAPDFTQGVGGGSIKTNILHGSNFGLNCESNENPEGKVKWTLKPQRSDMIVDLDVKTKVLELKRMNSSKEGVYTCVVENRVGKAEKSFRVLDVSNRLPEIQASEDVYAKNGEGVQLECSCRSCLPVTSSWNYSNKARRHNVTKLIDEDTDFFKTTISISKVEEQDAGTFTCLLSNRNDQGKHGKSKKNIQVVTHIEPKDMTIIGRIGERDVLVKEVVVLRDPIDFTLKCIANAYPIPTITWFKNAKKIGDSEVILSEHDKRNNDGNYTCLAENAVGITSLSVQVKSEIAPFTLHDKKRLVLADDEEKVELSCDIKGNPEPRITWMFKGQPLSLSRHTKLSKDKKTIQLTSRAETIGDYTCLGTNAVGKKSVIISVFIKGPPRIINPKNEVIKVQIKDNLILTCNTIGYPVPRIEWIRGGKVLQIGGSLKIKETGIYECKAKNVDGTARKIFNVSVVEPPTIDSIDDVEINPFEPKRSFEVVTCLAFGSPDPNIWWIFNGKKVHEGHRLNVTSLMLPGVYKCVAENSEGKAEAPFNVTKLKKPELLKGFDESESNQNVPEGWTLLELICPFKNYEFYIWMKLSTKEEKVLREHFNKTLKFSSVEPQSKGVYQCMAFNEAGNSTFDYQLDVLTKPIIEVVENEAIKVLEVGEELIMKCKSRGNPNPKVVWWKSAIRIGEGDSYGVKSVSVEDSGTYSCTAENSQDIATKSFDVEVFQAAYIEDGSENVRTLEFVNEALTLDCNILGHPKPNIIWLEDDVEITDRKNHERLVIKDFSHSDSGNYKCIGNNGFSETTIQFFISLKEPAKVVKVEITSSKDKDFFTISCGGKGRPLPDLTLTSHKSVLVSSSSFNVAEKLKHSTKHSTIFFNERGTEQSEYDEKTLTKSKFNFFTRMTVIDEGTLRMDVIVKKEYYNSLDSMSCVVRNDKGQDGKFITKPFLGFDDKFGSKITYTVVYGQPFDIGCPIVGYPEPKITWRFNDTLVNVLKSEMKRLDGGKLLKILKVQRKHGISFFKCKGENSAGTLSRKIHIDVDMKPQWTDFSDWGNCSVKCGEGDQKRKRKCILLDGSIAPSFKACVGEDFEKRSCKSDQCGGWGEWTEYSPCSRTCGKGYKHRKRDCTTRRDLCKGPSEEFAYCDNPIECLSPTVHQINVT